MSERWLGLVVASEGIDAVDLEVPASGPLVVQMQTRWKLQAGARPAAYAVMFRRIADHVRENSISQVVIKGSALSNITKMVHLEAAELRGVAAAACAAHSTVTFGFRAQISKNFGSRDTDEYLKDSGFWQSEVAGDLPVGRREAAFLVLAKTRPRP
jgi:hypothetical protein